MLKVLIAGGTGFIGTNLIDFLLERKFEVVLLSRKQQIKLPVKSYYWSPKNNIIDVDAFKNVDIVINIAGAGIADRLWTSSRKKTIVESRTKATKLLVDTINKLVKKPAKFISASAIGYYGNRPGEILNETRSPGKSFLSNVCQQWENSANQIESNTVKSYIIRIGVVLSEKGGFLPKIKQTSVFPLSLIPGNGQQYLSWIHLNDLLSVIHYLITNNCKPDVYNAVAPNPIKYIDLIKEITHNKKIIYVKLPAWFLKAIVGEFSSLFLDSQYILPENLIKQGFGFNFTQIDSAIEEFQKKKRPR